MRSALAAMLVSTSLVGTSLVGTALPTSSSEARATCEKTELFKVHGAKVWSSSDPAPAIFYKSGLAIDADGAYRAYHPDDRSGLDSLSHAGSHGRWWALVTDNDKPSGNPVVQGASDPAPGYYVSTTALSDPNIADIRNPRRYVDAATIPYIVLHPKALKNAQLGDFATVVNFQNGKISGALVADVSAPNLPVGEGSIALADALGVNSNARTGGKPRGVGYVIYSKSGNGRPRSAQEIAENSAKLFEAWGGVARLKACLAAQ
jgi:hypothetical protein